MITVGLLRRSERAEMRGNMESPVHVYQEIDSVDYDVVKSDPGDELELDILIYPPVFPLLVDSINPLRVVTGWNELLMFSFNI